MKVFTFIDSLKEVEKSGGFFTWFPFAMLISRVLFKAGAGFTSSAPQLQSKANWHLLKVDTVSKKLLAQTALIKRMTGTDNFRKKRSFTF